MGNATNAFDFDDSLTTFLAGSISDGTYADLLTTLKFDRVGEEAVATEIDSNAGQLWANLADDYILATYDSFYRATKVWRRADDAARDALGSDDGLAVDDIGYTEDRNCFFFVVTVDGPSASTWAGITHPGGFGTGADGAHTVAGTETLTGDVAYVSLVVPMGTVLETNGYKVWSQTFVLNDGTIRNNGGNASAATAGTGAPGGSLGAGRAGGAGGSVGAGGSGAAPVADTTAGSAGGSGGSGDGGAGGSAGTPDPPNAGQGGIELSLAEHAAVVGADGGQGTLIVLAGGTGGGGGAGDGASEDGGGGGGGGGVVVIATNQLINNGVIEALGGAGANGSGAGNTGGGGGGGGGLVRTIARSRLGTGSISVTGGAGGTGGGTGGAGDAGSDGVVQEFSA